MNDDTAYAIFEHDNSHWAAGLLQPGYRHVWCVFPDQDRYIGVNVGIDGLEIFNVVERPFDIEAHYRDEGADVVPVAFQPYGFKLRLPILMNSCVGVTKQVLGIKSWALTPHALHRYLIRELSHAHRPHPPGAEFQAEGVTG